jgi:hypothetical protein
MDRTLANNDGPLLRFLREDRPHDNERGRTHGELQPVNQNWLANPQMLKWAMLTARIMEFAYMEGSSPKNFPKVAADVFGSSSTHRTGCPKRPIMFIAHRVGGIILQKALTSNRAFEVLSRPRIEDYEFPDHIFANIFRGEPLLKSITTFQYHLSCE